MQRDYEMYLDFLCESYCSNKWITTKQLKRKFHSNNKQMKKIQATLIKEGYISLHSSGLLKVNYQGWEQFIKERNGSVMEAFFYAASLGKQYTIDDTTFHKTGF